MAHANDEWAIPAPSEQATRPAAPPINLIHQYEGRNIAIPFTIIAADDTEFETHGNAGLVARVADPKHLTLIIAVGENMMGPVLKVLNELAAESRGSAGFVRMPTAAEHIDRAQALADSPNGMLIHVGQVLRSVARAECRDAAETLFRTADSLRQRNDDRLPICR